MELESPRVEEGPRLEEEGPGPRCSPATLSRAESGACEREPRDMGTCLGSALGLGLGSGNLALALTLTLTERHGHLGGAHGYRAARWNEDGLRLRAYIDLVGARG